MGSFFRRLFNLYPGEHRKAFLFAFLGFLWSFAINAGYKFSDALFLIHVGATSLSTIYKIVPCCMFVLASFLLYAFHRFSTYRIFLSVVVTITCLYTLAYLCLLANIGIESKVYWYALRVFSAVSLTVTITGFWSFIDQYHHLQDAKRFYGLFSSMIFLGAACAGLIISSAALSVEHLILLIIGVLVCAGIWIIKIGSGTEPVHEEAEYEHPEPYPLKTFFSNLLRSKFTLFLIPCNLLIFLLWVTTEYNYLVAFDQHFDPGVTTAVGGEESAQLTVFLGKVLATVSFANIFIGLFLYSRMIRYFGLNTVLLFTPALFLLTFTSWHFDPTLLTPLLGYFIVEGLLIVVDDSDFSLLLHAVPLKIKHKVRVIIESFFEPIGMLLSGVLLSIPALNTKILGLILSILLFATILGVRRNYLKAIYANIVANAIHLQRTLKEWFTAMSPKERRSNEFRLLAYLKHGNINQQLLATEGLLGSEDPAILPRLLQLTESLDIPTRLKFLKQLGTSCFAQDKHVLELLQSWKEIPELQEPIQQYYAKLTEVKELPDSARLLHQLKRTNSHQERLELLNMLRKVADVSQVTPLIQTSVHFRPSECRYLERVIIAMGREAVPYLLTIVCDITYQDRCRVLAGRILGRIDLSLLRENLTSIISTEVARAKFYFYYTHTIQERYPEDNLDLLTEALHSDYHSVLDFIIQLLGVAGELEDCELLSRCMRSNKLKLRGQVIEALERTCEPEVFRLVYPIVSEISDSEKIRTFTPEQPLSLSELLDTMSQSPSFTDQIVAITLQHHLNFPNWKENLRQRMADKEEMFHHFARELLES